MLEACHGDCCFGDLRVGWQQGGKMLQARAMGLETQPFLSYAEKRRQVCEEQKEAATCVHKDAETPVLRRGKHAMPASGQHKPIYHVTLQTIVGWSVSLTAPSRSLLRFTRRGQHLPVGICAAKPASDGWGRD